MSAWTRYAQQLTRDKADTLLLLTAVVMVLAPHAFHLPWWISTVCAATLFWRGLITFRGLRMPHLLVLLPAAGAAMSGIYATYHSFLGRDTGVSMLVLLLAFKTLEMHAKRDLFVVIYLSFFLLLSNFFYSQSMSTGLIMTVCAIFLLCAQMSFQYTGQVPSLRRRLLFSARIVVTAIPLAAFLFIAFPRIQGPLWGMPGDASAGRTGLSDTMSPGNISNLAQNESPAFRVRFLDAAPAQNKMYWRGIVLGRFDGRTWTQMERGRYGRGDEEVTVQLRGAPIRQRITLEPSNARWLFALDVPENKPQLRDNGVAVSPEMELSAAIPLSERVRYEVSSYPNYALEKEANARSLRPWLILPLGFNPQAVALGRSLGSLPKPTDRIIAFMNRLMKNGYSYTLQPPALGRESVDELLFQTKAGFCEHYASAFVFTMRAAGVPARVVTGYQGGEFNPVDGYWTVRQSDAHAWAEVWLAERGWVRVDPTAVVAPDRLEKGAAASVPQPPPLGMEALRGVFSFEPKPGSWLAELRFQMAALNNGWNQWVLNYTPERQRGFLETLDALFMNLRTLFAGLLIALLLWLGQGLRKRRQLDPGDALYQDLCAMLAKRGLPRAPDEAPRAYAARLAAGTHATPAALQFLAIYSDYKYSARTAGELLPTLKRLYTESR